MKWIGQHIWDFISRFRSDVYLEATETGTIASGGNLGLDANNKIVKANTESGELSFTGSTADGMLTYLDADSIQVESTLMYAAPSVIQAELPANSFTAYAQTLTPTSAWATNSKNGVAFHTSFLNSRNTASGETNTHTGYKFGVTDTATHVGTIDYTGVDVNIDFANTDGTQKVKGIKNVLTDSDTADLYGIYQQVEDGGKDLYFLSSDDTTVDYFSLAVGASGATTMTTVDGGGAAADLTFNVDGSTIFAGPDVVVENAVTGMLTVQNTAANATGGTLNLKNTNNGADASNSDYCGYVKFWGQDDGTPSLTEYGNIDTQITDVANGNEAGTMRLRVLNNTGTGALLDGIAIYGNTDTDGEIDVDIASGTSSVTTIAGDLDIDGDTITSAGVLKIIPADVSGLALHIDADADTDNEVQIDAGVLDVNVTATATVDVATSLTITGKTLMNNRTLSVTAGSSAGEFDGDVVYTGTTTSMTTGALYVYANTGGWVLANAGAIGTTKGLLAIALGAASDVNGMLLRGMVTTIAVAGTPDEGAELYVRASDGNVTTVAPGTSGQFVRIIGYCIENSNNRIYFNPDNTYIEIA